MANPRGRPPLDRTDRSIPVSVTLPGRTYADVCRRASLERVSVPDIIRRAVALAANKNTETSGA